MKNMVSTAGRMKTVFTLLTLVFLLVSVPLLTGCQKRPAARPDAALPPAAKELPEASQQKKVPEKITEQKVDAIASKDLASGAAAGKEGMFEDILFDYDKYQVKESYKGTLQAAAAWFSKNSGATLSIEGHCDDRGTNEYNLALGDRRAKAVKDFLVSLGVPSSRIETISYGEEKPLCSDQTEECWAKNRRAHFVILMKAGK